jgi:hypothetical protein
VVFLRLASTFLVALGRIAFVVAIVVTAAIVTAIVVTAAIVSLGHVDYVSL